MAYFEELDIDRTIELPSVVTELEAGRRMLYMLKTGLGEMMIVKDFTEDVFVAVSPEFTESTLYTLEDLNEVGAYEGMFHVDDWEQIVEHETNHLAAHHAARIRQKGGSEYFWCRFDGLSFEIDNHVFRVKIIKLI